MHGYQIANFSSVFEIAFALSGFLYFLELRAIVNTNNKTIIDAFRRCPITAKGFTACGVQVYNLLANTSLSLEWLLHFASTRLYAYLATLSAFVSLGALVWSGFDPEKELTWACMWILLGVCFLFIGLFVLREFIVIPLTVWSLGKLEALTKISTRQHEVQVRWIKAADSVRPQPVTNAPWNAESTMRKMASELQGTDDLLAIYVPRHCGDKRYKSRVCAFVNIHPEAVGNVRTIDQGTRRQVSVPVSSPWKRVPDGKIERLNAECTAALGEDWIGLQRALGCNALRIDSGKYKEVGRVLTGFVNANYEALVKEHYEPLGERLRKGVVRIFRHLRRNRLPYWKL